MIHQLLICFKRSYDSERRKVLYKILKSFELPMKLVRLIKMCLDDMNRKAHTGKYLCGNFPA
jgi:hypothetical protein